MDSLTPEKMHQLEESGVIAKLESLDVNLMECLYDPTLADCLIRDIKDEIKADSFRAALKATDRSNIRLQLQQQALPGKPAEHDDFLTDNEDDSNDPDLNRLREQRLLEIKAAAAAAHLLALQGHGTLNDIRPSQLLDLVRNGPSNGGIVCHVFSTRDSSLARAMGEELDEFLERLSHQFQGTFFARLPASCLGSDSACHSSRSGLHGPVDPDSDEDRALEYRTHRGSTATTCTAAKVKTTAAAAEAAVLDMLGPEGAPALLVFRGDALAARSRVSSFAASSRKNKGNASISNQSDDSNLSSDILEEKVWAFLKESKALLKEVPSALGSALGGGREVVGYGRGEGARAAAATDMVTAIRSGRKSNNRGGGSESESESEDDQWTSGHPCAICGRRYPHEHVKAVGPKYDDRVVDSDDGW